MSDAAECEDIWSDLANGAEPLTLKAARRLPMLRRDGRQPDISTLWRWSDLAHAPKGLDGRRIVLATAKIGGTRCTTAAAVLRFVRALNPGPIAPAVVRSATRRRSAAERALLELEREGF